MTNQHRVVGQITADSIDHRVPENLRNRLRLNDDGIGVPTGNRTLRYFKVRRTLGLDDFSTGLACCKPTKNSDENHHHFNVGNGEGALVKSHVLEQLCERLTENLGEQNGNEPLQLSCESSNAEGAF